MRFLAALLVVCFVPCAMAEVQFVGAMITPNQKLFALRPGEGAASRWLSVGDAIEGFTIASYDAANGTLVLRKGEAALALRLPDARVGIAKDEAIAGLRKLLNHPEAASLRDLIHPQLRALFSEADLFGGPYPHLLTPGVKLEILPLSEEERKAFAGGLAELERVLGVRPQSGMWIRTAKNAWMSFVVETAGGWFMAPGVPKPAGQK